MNGDQEELQSKIRLACHAFMVIEKDAHDAELSGNWTPAQWQEYESAQQDREQRIKNMTRELRSF